MLLSALVRSQNVIEESDLPQALSMLLRVLEAGHLFPRLYEPLKVGLIRLALDEQMYVIRHDAVRKNLKLFGVRSTLNLLQDGIDGLGVHKDRTAIMDTDR